MSGAPQPEGLSGTFTHANLVAAFERASQANRRYLWFAQAADVNGEPELAAVFRTLADRLTGHAFGHLDYLAEVADPLTGQPLDESADHRAAALTAELEEAHDLYPRFAQTARAEGFTAIADWFDTVARAGAVQAEQLAATDR